MHTAQTTITLLLWPIISVIVFKKNTPQNAVLIVIMVGLMFLPNAILSIPNLPPINKRMIISLSLLLAHSTTSSNNRKIKIQKADIPIISFCFVSPIVSSLTNGMGLYRGVYESIFDFYLTFGVAYWMGRRYFSDYRDIKKIVSAFIIGGLIYVPLILWEIRMSPRLHVMIYGYFAHEWRQHFRYGGYRPIVFMQHGIMVALYMASTTTVAFWSWRSGQVEKLGRIPMKFIVPLMIIATVFCRTAAGWVYLILGLSSYYLFKRKKKVWMLQVLMAIVPFYIITRSTGLVSADRILNLFGIVFDDDRIQSMGVRLLQEDIFTKHIASRAILGWGGLNRAWPVDAFTGERLIRMIDPMWLIIFGKFGYLGLVGLFCALAMGPLKVLALMKTNRSRLFLIRENYYIEAVVLSLAVIFFMVDILANGMLNMMFIFCSGALISFSINVREKMNGEQRRGKKIGEN